MDLLNRTPFPADRYVLVNDGLETLLVVLKATFTVDRGATRPADVQEEILPSDEYGGDGDPQRNSIVRPADAVLFKPAADVLLRGHAYAAPGKTEVNVGFAAGSILKVARVVGDRIYVNRLVGAVAARPFEKIPLIWERAFGGTDVSRPDRPDACEENPVGRGFHASAPKEPVLLPNLEDPASSVKAPSRHGRVVGFGPIGPAWLPRRKFAGTYDDAWRNDRYPSLPKDFDPRFNQCAPADQILPGYVGGGEVVAVTGASPQGPIKFNVPRLQPVITVRLAQRRETLPVVCDTLIVDADAPSVTLVYRARLVVQGRVPDIKSIEVKLP